MADTVELAESRTFPPPPPFFKSFTKKNLDALRELAENAKANGTFDESLPATESLQDLEIAEELRYLVPPTPPKKEEKYRVFTSELDISGAIPTLASLSIEQLFPSPSVLPSAETDTEWTVDRVYYLRKLIRSIMLNFLELVGILATDSAQWLEKFEALRVQFYNAHSLVNEYRGHQARETLIMMMEAQLAEKRKEIGEIENLKSKIAGIMEGMSKDAPSTNGVEELVNGHSDVASRAVHERRSRQRAVWQTLNAQLGT